MKSLLVLLALTLSVTAIAKDTNNGRYTKNNGETIIRIEVGNDRDTDSRKMMYRMVQLERAVRELQNRVYDLEDDSRPATREVRVYTCEITSSFGASYLGSPALTELEAKNSAKNACTQNESAIFCGAPVCESILEYRKI